MKNLSILITYNKGISFLKDCLDSIGNQHFDDFEVILATDHVSPSECDALNELLQSFTFPIRSYALSEASGVAAARNLALSAATGRYIIFLDSDDYLDECYLDELFSAATEDSIVSGSTIKYWYGLNTYQKEGKAAITLSADMKPDYGSVLNLLIPHKIIRDKALRFEEGLRYYSDFPFVYALLDNTVLIYHSQAIYIKRNHNDSITHPSLSQEKDEGKPAEFLKSYNIALSLPYTEGRGMAVTHLCNHIIREFLYGNNPNGYNWPSVVKKAYADAIKNEALPACPDYSFPEKSFLRKFRKGHISTAELLGKLIVLRKRKKGKMGSRQQWGRAFSKFIFRRLPVKDNWIIFESFLGKSYADSCKGIYEYMYQRYGKQYKYIWFLSDKKTSVLGKATIIKPFSLRYFYYISRSKYWVNNMRQPVWFVKRPGMVFLETWHGTPLKKLVFDMDEVHSASPTYKMTFYRQSRVWDYLLSDNAFSTEVFERAFKYPRENILEMGYPRNDILYNGNNPSMIADIKRELNIPQDKKVILYAPTWRDDEYYAPGQYKFRLPLDLALLKTRLSGDYVLLLRMHYFIADHMEIHEDEKTFVKDVSRYDDIGRLYLVSDICITDYSSVFFDYANLKRPILFYVYDFEKYRDVLRGFYIDMETELPGPLLFTNEQVADAICNIDDILTSYSDRYSEFVNKYCSLDDGHAAERIVNRVFS